MSTQNSLRTMVFQPMPDLTPDQHAALRADIAERGVMVPVVVDQYGRLIDGHNREAIAAELGIDCPREVRHVADDDEAANLAVTLNCARRHLNREQVRQIIATEVERRPGDSDREIARRVGCDHKTVGSVRRGPSGEVPHPEPWSPPDDVDQDRKAAWLKLAAEWNPQPDLPTTDEDEAWLESAFIQDSADPPLSLLLLHALPVDEVADAMIGSAIMGRMALWRSVGISRRRVREKFEPWIDLTLSPSKRAKAAADGQLQKMLQRTKGSIDELVEVATANVASIPSRGGDR